jgi:hypothetical protein
MPPPPVPPAILGFVSGNLRNIEELELMIAIVQSSDRWWDARSASAEIGTDVVTAGRALDRLASLNLLDIRITGDVRYQFRPGSAEVAELARGCVAAYRSNPIALVRAVPRSSRQGIRDFAEAFRLRRK